MSATYVNNAAGESSNERSIDDLDELAALARMVTYAKCVAQDVELASAIHWLDLALQAINREIVDMPNSVVRDVVPFIAAAHLKAH